MLCKALVLLVCLFCFSSLADTTTTAQTSDLDDGTITHPNGGCPSGDSPITIDSYNWGTQAIRYGECVDTFAISIAINNALTASGISVDKVHYKWHWINGCFNYPGKYCDTSISNRVNTTTGEVLEGNYEQYFDSLAVTVEVTDANGTVIKTETWSPDKWYHWHTSNTYSTSETTDQGGAVWQIHEGNIELFNHITTTGTIYTPNQLGDVRFRIVANDGGEWNGYYGPVISNIQTWFTYRTNPCTASALYDPSCPGYAAAYATYVYDTACAASALYDSGCPGYAAAYYTQQCTADPLYDSGCNGYASAYYNQQCGLNALYDSGCTGYADAYYSQQCGISALYDEGCTGYAAAYYSQQCGISALYDAGCTGYAEAYFTQQCGISPLYNSGCDGYFEASCDADPLYDFLCTGYDVAYFNQQCTYNPQYDEQCTGYIPPVVTTDVDDIVDDGTGTGDSIVDSVIEAPALPPTVIIIPPPPEPEPMPEPEPEPTPEVVIVGPNVIETTPEVVEPPTIIEQIEQEIEQELEQELITEEVIIEPEADTEEVTEEVVEEEVVEEEVVEETDTEDSTEDETVEEEVVEEEALEEESEESAEDDVVEEESEEETTEEVVEEEKQDEPVVAKKTKKLTKKEKQKAKEKKMREIITEKLKELAIVMGEAQSLEDQQMLQQLIAALINYVPGFDAYGKLLIPGRDFYQHEDIYKDKIIPENNRGLRNGLASELLHKKMVDMQYEGME